MAILTLVPNGAFVSLEWCDGAWFLSNHKTQERLRVPRDEGAPDSDAALEGFELELDDDGVAYLDSGEASIWAHKLFRQNLYTTADNEVV